MFKQLIVFVAVCLATPTLATELSDSVKQDYDEYLAGLFDHFHRNPELSTVENETARRMALELSLAGYVVTEGVGGTGVVAIMENGEGPLVMMRADMDGLPIEEKSGLENASRAQQKSPITGNTVYTMHACGHDVHITSMVGTARHMAAHKDEWKGTLMLVVQPAEERVLGAAAMREDDIWGRFGKPDYALAFHVNSLDVAGKINVTEGSPFAGADTVDIIIHGVGAHGAHAYAGKDPIVLGAQIVLALQTLVSRELPPLDPGVITVGSIHGGTKRNVIPDAVKLELTVRSYSDEVRQQLLEGISRIAKAEALGYGLPDNLLPEITYGEYYTPAVYNTPELNRRMLPVLRQAFGEDAVVEIPPVMGGEECARYGRQEPRIPSHMFALGSVAPAQFKKATEESIALPSLHSPFFSPEPEQTITTGIKAMTAMVIELLAVPDIEE